MKPKEKSNSRTNPWQGTIYGQPYSKANNRRLVKVRGKTVSIKSQNALDYLKVFHMQCPQLNPLFEKEVYVEITIYYASRRSDLDESLILDAMQGRIYRNDRQVRQKFIRWGIDHDRPRAEIRVSPLGSEE